MKRVRFSLLSLVMGVMLAGGVGCLNERQSKVHVEPFYKPDHAERWLCTRSYGWPLTACSLFAHIDETQMGSPAPIQPSEERIERLWAGWDKYPRWHWPSLAADIAIGLAIVFGGVVATEYMIRRRAKKTET